MSWSKLKMAEWFHQIFYIPRNDELNFNLSGYILVFGYTKTTTRTGAVPLIQCFGGVLNLKEYMAENRKERNNQSRCNGNNKLLKAFHSSFGGLLATARLIQSRLDEFKK